MQEALAALGLQGSPGAIVTCALLLAARLAPIAWLAPWVAPMGSPAIVRTATLVAIVAALLGLASVSATIPTTSAELVFAIARELVLGLALAIASSVPLVAFEHVGRGLDAWRPSREDADGTYSRLFAALGAAAFVAIGGLRVVMRALGEGLGSTPLGEPLAAADAASIAMASAHVVTMAITFAVSLAAPALVALFAAELGIAIALRGARVGRALDAALGVRGGLVLGAVLLAIAAALPELPALTRWAVEQMS